MHRPIIIDNISLSFPNKLCFDEFSSHIYPGSRIAIIGRNGSGKSSLLQMLAQRRVPSSGNIHIADEVNFGYVPQLNQDDEDAELSGSQRFHQRLSAALASQPDLLLLDEPTNHLDRSNRKSLLMMLKRFHGTLVLVSHDTELLDLCVDTLWHIENSKIEIFNGSYCDFVREHKLKQAALCKQLADLKSQEAEQHQSLMQEQKRAARSKAKGKKSIDQRKWPTVVSKSKALRAEVTTGNKRAAIGDKRQKIRQQLADLNIVQTIVPKFHLAAEALGSGVLLSISDATIAYSQGQPILNDVRFSLASQERVAVLGDNACGKSTLLKAIMGDPTIRKTGEWCLPNPDTIGYLDQHYMQLNPKLSLLEALQNVRPDWQHDIARRHLNDFLFRSNEEVHQPTASLSGGEQARASLALLAAKAPRMLVLDEVSNNLDLVTKQHVIDVLKAYPGTLLVVSHDASFLEAIGIQRTVTIANQRLTS